MLIFDVDHENDLSIILLLEQDISKAGLRLTMDFLRLS